jgi:hypothetical protein
VRNAVRPGLALALAALGLAGCTSARDHDVKANRAVFAQVPGFPGARLTSETSAAYSEDEDGPIVGYTTRFDLSLPPRSSPRAVAAFYRRRLLPRWRLVEALDGPVLNFRRGEASVSINLESWRAHILEIAVDHAAYGAG